MKKMIALLLCLVLLVGALAGCGSSSVEPSRGTWDDYVYTNEYLGLRFVLPPGWTAATDAEIAQQTGVTLSILEAAGADMPEDFDVLVDMVATSSLTGASIQVQYSRVGGRRMPPIATVMDELNTEFAAIGGRILTDTQGSVTIGTYEWYYFDVEITMMGYTIHSRAFLHFLDGFMRQISINVPVGGGSVEDILVWFVGADDPLPERPELVFEHAEELVGFWFWDEMPAWTYEFHADGTGSRGINDDEVFTWHTIGDNLIIDAPLMVESWTFTIVDDVLTLESRQVQGLIYSYILQSDAPAQAQQADEPQEQAEELVGLWAWNEMPAWTYEFHADGTGTRGVSDDESFTWHTVGDNLIIDAPLMVESWTFTIAGNVLTLESRQVQGMIYSYILQS